MRPSRTGTSRPRPCERGSKCVDRGAPWRSGGQADAAGERQMLLCLIKLARGQRVMGLQTPVGSKG